MSTYMYPLAIFTSNIQFSGKVSFYRGDIVHSNI